jgi:hypothetical protein
MTTTATPAPPPKSGHPPIFISLVGIFFLALWIVGVMTQIQTNQALITGGQGVNVYQPNWRILIQPVLLVVGGLGANEAIATLVGWGIELVYLGFIIGYEHLHHSVSRSGQVMAKLFRFGAFAIIIFNGWTDYNYGTLGGGEWGHFLFALVMSFVVGYFGTIGMYLLEIGWHRS